MKNYIRGLASLSMFFILSIVLSIFFLNLGFGEGGVIIAIAISIFSTSTFGYKSLDEQYEEDLRNPKYLHQKNNLLNNKHLQLEKDKYEDLSEDYKQRISNEAETGYYETNEERSKRERKRLQALNDERNSNYNETGYLETNSERSDREQGEYDYEDESMKRFIDNSDEHYKSLINKNTSALEEE